MTAGTRTGLARTATRPTDVRGIGAALRSLWRDCCPEEAGGDVARSLTTNFVMVAAAEAEAEARAALDRVFPRTPCRAFLFLVDGARAAVDTEVTAVTRCHGDTRDIVLEEVVVRLPTARLARLPGIVRPLLVNDLPGHLYWRHDWPRDEALANASVALCEHLIVDSQRGSPTFDQLELLRDEFPRSQPPRNPPAHSEPARNEPARSHGVRVTDLTWLRLRPWRRALAEAFERITWQPGQPTRAIIRHASSGSASVVMLARWLERRLGATIDLDESGSSDPDHVLLTTGAVEVCIELEHGQLAVYVTTDAHCDLPFRLPASRGSEGDLLAAAVDVG